MGIMTPRPAHEAKPQQGRKADIAREFGNARNTYDSASRLQCLMGDAMLQALQSQEIDDASRHILDLGCGTGWFTRKLASLKWAASTTGVDLSPGMIQQAKDRGPDKIHWLIADAETAPLPDQSFDLIFSNLMIQWCADPCRVLQECRRLLKPGGRLMVSTLLDGTLKELKQAWQAADPGQEHVNRFEPEATFVAQVSAELPQAAIETRTIRLPYASPQALAGELKRLGAGFKGLDRRRTVTAPGRLRAMCRQYPVETDGRVMASYEAAWVSWVRP